MKHTIFNYDRNREWYTTYHKEAATTDDIKLCRELYEERIKLLEDYNKILEAALGLEKELENYEQ